MSVEKYQIQKAMPKHCKEIMAIAKDGQVFNYWLVYAFLVFLGWTLVMLDKQGKVMGYTCFAPIPFSRVTFTIQAAFKPEHRNKGLGTHLLDFTCHFLRVTHNSHKLYAHTLKPRVFRFLKRMGWESVGEGLGLFFVKKSLISSSDRPPE